MRWPQDQLGLGRFRDKYAAKMAATPDAHAFQIVSAPLGSSGDEFAAVAHAAASADTLETFLREMKTRYPDSRGRRRRPPPPRRRAERIVSPLPPDMQARGAVLPPAAAGPRRRPHRDAVVCLGAKFGHAHSLLVTAGLSTRRSMLKCGDFSHPDTLFRLFAAGLPDQVQQ